MSLYTIYFSPTGGTKRIVQRLANSWNQTPHEINLFDDTLHFNTFQLQKDDVCLIAVPSFGGRVPAVALQHLSQIKGDGAQAIIIVSYGNRAFDDTLLELQDSVNVCGFRIVGAVAAIAEHSILRQFAKPRPDEKDVIELDAFAQQLIDITRQANPTEMSTFPGNKPFRPYGGVPLKPKASKRCTRCGLCTTNCPVAAIPTENPSLTINEACISCMSCIKICPNNARSNSKLLLMIAGNKLKKVCSGRKENELFIAK